MSKQKKEEPMTSAQTQMSVRERIIRGGKTMSVICKLLRICLVAGFVMDLGLLIASFFTDDAVTIARESFQESALLKMIYPSFTQNGPQNAREVAIACGILLVADAVLLIFVQLLYKLFRHLAEGGRPFTLEAARKMRRYSWLLLQAIS